MCDKPLPNTLELEADSSAFSLNELIAIYNALSYATQNLNTAKFVLQSYDAECAIDELLGQYDEIRKKIYVMLGCE